MVVANSSVPSFQRRSIRRHPQILAASVVISDTSYALSINRPPPTPPAMSLSPRDRLPPLTPSSLLSITWARKNTAASADRDVHSGALSPLLIPPTPLLSSLNPRAQLNLPTPPLLLPITQFHHCNAAASVVVPESSTPPLFTPIPFTYCLFLVLRQRLHCRY